MSRLASLLVAVPTVIFAHPNTVAPEKVKLTIGTLHAAALTTSRGVGDSTDLPFFVMSVIGPRVTEVSLLPGQPMRIRLDQALGARPLTEVSLADGDSVQVLVSVLDNSSSSFGTARLVPPPKAMTMSAAERVDQVQKLVAPVVQQGANAMGAVSLLITNEGGAIYWRRLDCVTSCKVLTAPGANAIPAAQGQLIGVVELSGSGGTYHLQLSASR